MIKNQFTAAFFLSQYWHFRKEEKNYRGAHCRDPGGSEEQSDTGDPHASKRLCHQQQARRKIRNGKMEQWRYSRQPLETIQLSERLATGNTLMLSEKKAWNVWNSSGCQGAKRILLTTAFNIWCPVIADYSESKMAYIISFQKVQYST